MLPEVRNTHGRLREHALHCPPGSGTHAPLTRGNVVLPGVRRTARAPSGSQS
jgi:hypothetical protein